MYSPEAEKQFWDPVPEGQAILYGLADPMTKETRYVGFTKRPSYRYWQHNHNKERSHKSNWIKSLAPKQPLPFLIYRCDLALVKQMEIWLIAKMRASGFRLTNATPGGDGNTDPSPELCKRFGSPGEKNPCWGRRGSAHPKFGKPNSLESCRKIGEAQTGIKNHRWGQKDNPIQLKLKSDLMRKRNLEKGHPMAGRLHSEEAKRKMSLARKGIPKSETHRANMSKYQSDPAVRKARSEHMKAFWAAHPERHGSRTKHLAVPLVSEAIPPPL